MSSEKNRIFTRGSGRVDELGTLDQQVLVQAPVRNVFNCVTLTGSVFMFISNLTVDNKCLLSNE